MTGHTTAGGHGLSHPPVVAVLGLGEAGGLIASDLRARGIQVRSYDPRRETRPDNVSEADAVAGANVAISLTTAEEAEAAARAATVALGPGQVYADANTSSGSLKQHLAQLVEATGAAFADVALMAPVPGRGLRTPAIASGRGAAGFAAALLPLEIPVEVMDGPPGVAAQRKLFRSIAWKGLAAVVTEAIEGARAAGVEGWMRTELVNLLAEADIDRMLEGSLTHAARREREMADVAAQLRELSVEPRMSEAARSWLEELRDHR